MPQPSPFDALLAQVRELFAHHLCGAVAAMFDHADESLSALSEKATEEELQKRYLDARDLASANREVIEAQFRTRFMAEFQKRTNQVKKIGQNFSDFSLDDLQLVSDEDLDETLKFKDMAGKLRRYCEEELSALGQRGGVLLRGANLEADDNPLGPPGVCDAYKHPF